MQIFDSLDISSSGLSVQRRKLTAIASNLANVDTTRTDEGGPYKRRRIVMLEAPKMSKFSTMLERAGNRLRMTNGKHRPEGRMSPGEFFLDSGVLSQEVGLKVATWQLVLVDMLFLCLAVGMGLWFRAWLQREKVELAQRLQLLQAQQANLERVSGRLQAFFRSLELMGRDAEAAKARVGREEAAVELAPENEDVYSRAWDLLAREKQPAEVARALGIGVAEVELMSRMLRHRRQG